MEGEEALATEAVKEGEEAEGAVEEAVEETD